MVDWNQFGVDFLTSVSTLIVGTFAAYWLIHRYQKKKHKKEIRDELIDDYKELVRSITSIMANYYKSSNL